MSEIENNEITEEQLERLNELGLHPMKDNVLSHHQHKKSNTGWAISVDAAKV